MVILDNHVTRPGWCCSNTDGNGFFGDQYFKPEEWVHGLTIMASLFRGVSNVVGMSLRNELRGPNQNVDLWYKYVAYCSFIIFITLVNIYYYTTYGPKRKKKLYSIIIIILFLEMTFINLWAVGRSCLPCKFQIWKCQEKVYIW